VVATILTIVAYGALLVVGGSLRAGGAPTIPTPPEAAASSSIAPRASVNPLRSEIEALIQIDERLIASRKELRTLLEQKTLRGSDVAFAMRRINSALALGPERAARLSNDSATREVGSQLEVLYASASTSAAHALDLAIGSDEAYRQAAQEIVDLFVDLPTIDATLKGLLVSSAIASTAPSPSASVDVTPSGPTSPSPLAPASGSPAPIGSVNPMERLRDPGFERGLEQWALVLASPADQATASSDKPLGDAGTASLRLDISASDGTPAAIGVKEDGIVLQAGVKYAARVMIRSSGTRSAQIRLIGPNEELFGIAVAQVGPEATELTFDTYALLDEPNASFRIDISGTQAGQVWLDDATLTQQPPG
jgi:hypothetical protein